MKWDNDRNGEQQALVDKDVEIYGTGYARITERRGGLDGFPLAIDHIPAQDVLVTYRKADGPMASSPYGTTLPEPIPMILFCPLCGTRHVDEGELATRPHSTHACQMPTCGLLWKPALVHTVGVWHLPGSYDGLPVTAAVDAVQRVSVVGKLEALLVAEMAAALYPAMQGAHRVRQAISLAHEILAELKPKT